MYTAQQRVPPSMMLIEVRRPVMAPAAIKIGSQPNSTVRSTHFWPRISRLSFFNRVVSENGSNLWPTFMNLSSTPGKSAQN